MLAFVLMAPFLSALLLLVFKSRPKTQSVLSVGASLFCLILSVKLFLQVWNMGPLTFQAGSWPAPFGISYVADVFGALMTFITFFLGLVVNIYTQSSRFNSWRNSYYAPLFHFLLAGVSGAFLTGDFFNLYVFFEIFLMSSFALLTFERSEKQLGAVFKYTLLNLLGSAVFLVALALMYNAFGTLNMAHVAQLVLDKLPNLDPAKVQLSVFFFVLAFLMKAGVFPLWNWLPASYPVTAYPIAALLAGLLTKVGVYALVRLKSFGLIELVPHLDSVIIYLSVITQFVGVLGAATQTHFSRILSFHILSQIGYMVLCVGLKGEAAFAACVLYLIHHIVVKTNLFMVGGAVESLFGTSDLKKLGGVLKTSTVLAVFFSIPAFSLVGIPPLSGFWAKVAVLKEAWSQGYSVVFVMGLVTSFLTLYSMTKIWKEVFLKAPEVEKRVKFRSPAMIVSIAVFCLWTLAFSGAVEWAWLVASKAGAQLMDVSIYISVVK